MTINLPGTGSNKPVDNNRPAGERTVNKVNKTEPIRFFTSTDGKSRIDRRRSPDRRSRRLERRLLQAEARTKVTVRRQGPRERRRSALLRQRKGNIGENIGGSVDREV